MELKTLVAIVLCGPGAVGTLSLGVPYLLGLVHVRSVLAYLAVLGLGACYVVPFSLAASALGLAVALWSVLHGHEDTMLAGMMSVFLTGTFFSCTTVVLFLLLTRE